MTRRQKVPLNLALKSHLLAPYAYISSLPSKGFREAFLDGLNVWLALPESTLKIIKTMSQKLHSASLMLDDIEDSSPLRRGNPATYTIFGPASTIILRIGS
ncbi:unnamed protein product [Penicillium nalgiovense]|nr:unnamed protein product [Penicillium nalgiovense]